MTHKLAKEHEVRPGVKHVGSEGVAQDVRTSAGEIGDGSECCVGYLIDSTWGHRCALAADEEGLRRTEDRGAQVTPRFDFFGEAFAEGDDTLFAPLT